MSVRARLLLLVLSIVIPAIATCVLTGYLVFVDERSRAETHLLAATRATAASVDREVNRLISNLKVLAASPALISNDLQAFHQHAKQSTEEGFWIVLALPSGQQVVNTLLPFGADLPRLVTTENINRLVEEKKPIVTDVFQSKVLNMPVVAVQMPVINEGTVTYILNMGISLTYLDALLRSHKLPPSWVAGITDRKGTLMARSHGNERFVGTRVVPELLQAMTAREEGLVGTTTLEGIPALSAFSVGPTIGWRIAIGVPRAELTNAIGSIWLVASGAGLVIVGMGLAISLLVARGMARAIGSLVEPAASLGTGGSPGKTPTGLTEVDTVAAAMARAGALLVDRERKLHAAVEKAERAVQAQTRFFAAASHDLRQPFQAMRLFFEVLKQRATPELTPVVDRLGEAIGSAEELLNDLLDVARLESDGIRPHPVDVDLGRLIRDIKSELDPVAVEKGLTLRLRGCAPRVRTDPMMLKRILFNVASNAIRYTEKGGVLIGVRRRPGCVRIEVWDTGIGIPEDHAALVFEEFYQVENSARDRSQGTGLGLAIVKRLAGILGCEVTFSSRVGRGTVFRVALPLVSPE